MNNEDDIYFIPVNYTDAGRILGLFDVRNCIEAALLALPTIAICSTIAHFITASLTIKLIISLCLLVPICGFALIGIRDDALSRFLTTYIRWHRRRRITLNKGESIRYEHKRSNLRRTDRHNQKHSPRN